MLVLGTSSSGGSSAAKGSYTFWDPYPQYDATSPGPRSSTRAPRRRAWTIKRSGYDTSGLTNKALLAGQQSNSPDILLVDNPVVSTLASAGILTTTDQNKLVVGDVATNILSAGVIDSKTYGVPIGSNTLALYYNPTILKAAGCGHPRASPTGRP